MGLLRKAIVVASLGVVIKYLLSLRQDPVPPPVFGGHVEPGYEAVEKAFRQNFEDGFEPDGAAFAVCHRGKIVVDLWGGYADKVAMRPWTENTMTTAFSTTKGVAALVIALLVDKGHFSYDDLVIKYWPEFGAHGKANVTVKWLVGHQAGLAGLDGSVTFEAVQDWRKMSKLFEHQVPNWPPGTEVGYHAFTFGWLCDQLVRRVDPQHRSIGEFFRDEIATPFDIDFYIGLPRDQLYRVARMTLPTFWDLVRRLDNWFFVKFFFKHLFGARKPLIRTVTTNPDWLDTSGGHFRFNNPDIHELEVPGANGVGTARALARLFCLLDGPDLLSKAMLDKISQPVLIDKEDQVIGFNITSGWGFMFTKGPQGTYQMGHPGYGGQNAKFDPREHLAYGYLRNNMAPDIFEITRTARNLEHALYESVKTLKSKG